jgi:hypothetical protein
VFTISEITLAQFGDDLIMKRLRHCTQRLARGGRFQHLLDPVEPGLGLGGRSRGGDHLRVDLLNLEVAQQAPSRTRIDNVVFRLVVLHRPRRGAGLIA